MCALNTTMRWSGPNSVLLSGLTDSHPRVCWNPRSSEGGGASRCTIQHAPFCALRAVGSAPGPPSSVAWGTNLPLWHSLLCSSPGPVSLMSSTWAAVQSQLCSHAVPASLNGPHGVGVGQNTDNLGWNKYWADESSRLLRWSLALQIFCELFYQKELFSLSIHL